MKDLEHLREQILLEQKLGGKKTHYSNDIRERAVEIKNKYKMSFQKLGELLNISPSTLSGWGRQTQKKFHSPKFKQIPVEKNKTFTLKIKNSLCVENLNYQDLLKIIKDAA